MILPALTKDRVQFSAYLSAIKQHYDAAENLETIIGRVPTANAYDLLTLKSQFSLCWAKTEYLSFDEMGEIWSRFADATLDRALELAWIEAAKRHRLQLPDGKPPGLFLLGLGKLGGQDLNFSSDVDLIGFFDTETLPVPTSKGQAYIASDICKRVTQILQPRNSPDFVWRVDWRLRPESSGTGLAMSTAKAETFYFFRSLPWHRLALMKARVVAGDKTAGSNFLERLDPYIWKRNLDYRTIDELASLKTRINNEHPGLQYERSTPDPITDHAAGFNLKLGRGGIREIEFIANAQQLIHGGKRPALRVTHTRTALTNLSETQLLEAEESNTLKEDYAFFRQVENAVQMIGNEQTHIIPEGKKLETLLNLIGNPTNFDQSICERRQRVHQKFSALFAEAEQNDMSVDISSLSGANAKVAQSWANGFQDHGLPLGNQTKYRDLGQRLCERILSQHREEKAFQRVDSFLKAIGRSEQYFALLSRHPKLLNRLITPLLHSPHMGEILRQSPHIIDIFIAADDSSLEEQSHFVLSSSDYEHRLESLRRFVNEQIFLSYSKFLDGAADTKTTQLQLTRIAEQTLELSIQIVAEDLGLPSLPMTVLGLGKMGTQAMAPQSDLDLVFLFSDDIDTQLATKIVQRLRTTLTVKLREGIAYELDMRLRPSGRSGPPAVKLSAFRHHHMNRAHSWEHIALAPARIVAGDRSLGEQVMGIKAEIFDRPRNAEAFKTDAVAMLKRLRSDRMQPTQPDVWRTKLRNGGLMEADYMRSCLIVLDEEIPQTLVTATEKWNTLQIWERLLGLKGKNLSETPARFAKTIGADDLKRTQIALETSVGDVTSAFFSKTELPEQHDSKPILWENS